MGSKADDKTPADPALARLRNRCLVTVGWLMLWTLLGGLCLGAGQVGGAMLFAAAAGFQCAWFLARVDRLICAVIELPR